jgi:hypothetical protein
MKNMIPMLLTALIAFSASAAPANDEAEFDPLFNEKDLTGWEGDPKVWSVKDGTITGQTTAETKLKQNTFLINREVTVDDFELRLSYKIVGGNSGIQYRSQDHGNFVIGGYQADFEAGKTYSGILYEERGRGILAQRGQMTRVTDQHILPVGSLGKSDDIQAGIKNEDWNDYVIIARGNRLTHIINGRVTVDVTDDSKKRSLSGLLALQVHTGPPMTVQFKNIRIRPIR